jgi:peptide/nickel transport system substrate-binding protein
LVFDTLYGTDAQYRVQPQMVEGAVTENDGREWRLTLRDGLRFHDGTPVLARDVVASLKRWGQRDTFGQALLAATDELSAESDKVVRFRLKHPFPLLPDALGKLGTSMPAIMPERLARVDAMTQVTEMVGSGPFRFRADEWRQGDRIVYERFENYVPRPDGVPSRTAGPKIAYFDRVEWQIIPDVSSAVAALQRGEVDWVFRLEADMVPVLRRDRNLTVRVIDELGVMQVLRFNQLTPPFNNPAIRRALLGAVDQTDYMQAAGGLDRGLWTDHCGVFTPGTPLATDAGLSVLTGPRDYARVKRDLAEAGYRGERVVFLGIWDIPQYRLLAEVATDMFRKIGMNVDAQATDYATTVQRRGSTEPVERGGWSVLQTGFGGVDMASPASAVPLRGNGRNAWFGWPDAPRLEALRDAWFAAPDLPTQQAVCRDLQLQAWQDVPFIPLGVLRNPVAYRANLQGVLDGNPMFWNVRRA